MGLIDDLQKEHAALVQTLNSVKELGITSKAGQEKLLAAKTGLLAHLKREDAFLYPTLRRAAEKDARLEKLLEFFAKDMGEISTFALQFFDKYEKGGSGIDFARDFGRLFATLNGRINKEESLLYKEFEKL